ncbi:HAD-IIA family hydrolase [Vibrio parahaemolyticus]|uniref:HAD-IIA family hydrolase n=3 Tax=Vibrio parahaemolyticus TaxID=670 RepID=UPI000423B383|nr:HAD-IIA family hydrolase [Vibrio parahaemolyticus]EJG0952461.1 HAD-IIA family hydrolase [Vibrio parahaemolyticus O1:K58]EIB6499055.1 HAD-IIA family hydrolase [Vibrio parahaemolyticus]EII5694489.1 HAD-IIA family hydrolase [Vibrio parahaemolyticus]EIJ2988146.1 HAD-IIA family hydrolase [Vibrio parahaemolyticus]EIN9490822.1 HAD-IIA family hydrolase [Vibrio parahaemolyticus]
MIYTHAFFDLDGTIYVDGKLLPGIKDGLKKLESSGTEIYYMTNNTSVSLAKYYEKLNTLGIPTKESCVISPTVTLADWLRKTKYRKIYTVGTIDFSNEVCSLADCEYSNSEPDIVVVGFDRELTYEKLQTACAFINRGIPWVITHIDLACPSENGPIPDCGAIANLISHTTGKQPMKDFGKPSDIMCDLIRVISKDSDDILVSGDRVYTDAAIGLKLGATTVLVCTGEYQKGNDNLTSNDDINVVDSLSDFLNKVL